MEPGRTAIYSKKRRLETDITVSLSKLQKIPADMFCWGSTVYGELGLGGIEEEIIPGPREVNFQKATEIHEIACGDNYTVLITNDGQVYSCGNNDYGQLGHEKPRKRLQLVSGLDAFVFRKVACGASHTMAVNEWGHVFTWGSNYCGQLGLNSTQATEPTPRMIKALVSSVVVQVACGLKHALALTNNGELYSWGLNDEGQLGHGSEVKFESKPRLISALAGVPIAFIACGGYHSIVVSKSGVIYAWGRNTFGQLGVDGTLNYSLPNQLKTLRHAKVRYIVCGEDFSAFLTLDGGVFTCGAGMYGQLGHGSNNNEILPRQVVELMGSVVTQICCGKRHMLALVSARNRVYSWGLGGAGQLGINATRTVTTPKVVLGPWASQYTVDSTVSAYGNDCVVKHIFSGGDHCFATVTKREEAIPPDDCRVLESTSQILTVDEEHLVACQKIASSAPIDHDLITYLETVFRSLACINASFLLANDAHYGCSSKISGIDVQQALKIFGIIQDLQNNTIQELIFTSITESLMPSLVASPPDIETLRVYVTLPLYHGFLDPVNYQNLHHPYARVLLSLKNDMRQTIGSWLCAAHQIFHRLIRVFKLLILYILKNKINRRNDILGQSLHVLEFLHKLNEPENAGPHVPYSAFHLPELAELIEIRSEYLKWLTSSETHVDGVLFCNYPFLFDAPAKTILLETDQAVQMHSAMSEAATRAFRRLFNPLIEDSRLSTQFLILNVSREHLVSDTIRELSEYDSNDLKKPLRVKFHGEEAEDAGGVKKEFFMLLLKEILDPKYGMFKQYEETRAIWFIADSLEDEIMYALIGILCGLAIYNFIIIDLPFPLALYKKLLQEPVCLTDLKDLSPTMARSLQDVLDYEGDDVAEVFCLNFEVTRDVYGEKKTFELIPNGSKIMVNKENRKEFVDLYVDYIFNKSVQAQFDAFYRGFHKVCGGRVLKLFHSHELMAVVVGNENYDWKELQENTIYKEGYSKDDPTIVMFWEVFHSLDLAEKKKFLLFLTGSDRIPIQGMKAIKINIQPMSDDRYLPVAHTCFDLLDLPRYQTRERLRYKLLQAIQQTQGFSLV